MARKFTVKGETYKVEFSGDRTWALVEDAVGTNLGDIRQTTRPDGVVVWQVLRRPVFCHSALDAARTLVKMHLERLFLSDALEAAYRHVARLEVLAREAEARRAYRERMEAQERERRATLPMLSVLTRTDSFWTANGVVEFTVPTEVLVYGERSASLYRRGGLMEVGHMTVSCGGTNDLSPEQARERALALLRAADEADRWNREVRPDVVARLDAARSASREVAS